MEGLHPGPELSMIRPAGTPNIVEADVFPPARSQAPDPSIFLPYTTEDINFEDEYEEYMSDIGWAEGGASTEFEGTSAWSRFPTEFAADIADGISDSESIVSIGDLGEQMSSDRDSDMLDENRNDWEVR